MSNGNHRVACERLRDALSLWRGPALADFAFEPFAQQEITRLEELRLGALEDRIAVDLQLGMHSDVVAELESLVSNHPLRERFSALLMVALYRSGRQADALHVYQRLRTVLLEDLGVDPTPDLQDLERAVLEQRPSLGPVPRTEVQVRRRSAKNNLSQQLSSFIGRTVEIDELNQLLGDTRLLTITGPGGAGKTRLASEVAASLLEEEYRDGVWFVQLAGVTEPRLVAQSVANVLQVRERSGRTLLEELSDFLQERQTLIILDNCEHLPDACAELVFTLLSRCAQLRFLTTSRAPLKLPGEKVWPIPSLSMPATGSAAHAADVIQHDAVQLFSERARAVRPSFQIEDSNSSAVAEICERLDGNPLAIELAAARVGVLSVEQIAARLDDRFRFLVDRGRGRMSRHQSLHAAMSWSHDLLTEDQRVLFRRLAVFAGHTSLEAVEEVCAGGRIAPLDVLDLLNGLVDNSLVAVTYSKREIRYWLLQTIREYGREELRRAGEEQHVHRRHLEWFARLVEASHDKLRGSDQRLWLERLDTEHDNLRIALEWALSNEPQAALRVAGELWWFWLLRGHFTEGRRWLEEALARDSATPSVARSLALGGAGVLAAEQGELDEATHLLEQNLRLARELGYERGIMSSLNNLGALAEYRGDYQRSAEFCEQSIQLSRESGDDEIVASALINLAASRRELGQLDEARSLLQESMRMWRGHENNWGVAEASLNLAIVARAAEDYAEATRLGERSQALYRELGDKEGIANSCMVLGGVLHRQRDDIEATRQYRESLDLYKRLGDREGLARTLEGLAAVARETGDPERAARLVGAAEAVREAIGAPLPPTERSEHDREIAHLGKELGDESFVRLRAEGHDLSQGDIDTLAREVIDKVASAQRL